MNKHAQNTNISSKRVFLQSHKNVKFTFLQNKFDFIVEELPVQFKEKGNFLILKIKKQYLSTWELLALVAQQLHITENMIGYAGLKDKNATTTQYISIPLNKSRDYEKLNSKNIEILATYKHDKKLQIGDLVGNRFTITLKDVKEDSLPTLYQTLSHIQKHGMLNYFGYQRFGDDTTFEQCKDLVYGETSMSDKKLEHLLMSAYQSYFFNSWLATRVKMAKEKGLKKLTSLDGDVFYNGVITGLLPGRYIKRATLQAREIEQEFDDEFIHIKGFRRDAWIFPQNISNKYDKENNWLTLNFELPKGSYATVLIENLLNKNFK